MRCGGEGTRKEGFKSCERMNVRFWDQERHNSAGGATPRASCRRTRGRTVDSSSPPIPRTLSTLRPHSTGALPRPAETHTRPPRQLCRRGRRIAPRAGCPGHWRAAAHRAPRIGGPPAPEPPSLRPLLLRLGADCDAPAVVPVADNRLACKPPVVGLLRVQACVGVGEHPMGRAEGGSECTAQRRAPPRCPATAGGRCPATPVPRGPPPAPRGVAAASPP